MLFGPPPAQRRRRHIPKPPVLTSLCARKPRANASKRALGITVSHKRIRQRAQCHRDDKSVLNISLGANGPRAEEEYKIIPIRYPREQVPERTTQEIRRGGEGGHVMAPLPGHVTRLV